MDKKIDEMMMLGVDSMDEMSQELAEQFEAECAEAFGESDEELFSLFGDAFDAEQSLVQEEELESDQEQEAELDEDQEQDPDSENEQAVSAGNEEGIDSMKLYLRQIGQVKLLTAEEEKELGRRIAEGGPDAKEARDCLVVSNLKLVIHYAKHYLGRGVELEDLNSMGIEGLIHAAEKFDYTKGFRFSTYASWWINQNISRGIAEYSNIIRIPVYMRDTCNKIRKAQAVFRQEYHREATVAQLAEACNLTESRVLEAFSAMYSVLSFDAKVKEDGDTTLEDFLEDQNAVDPSESVMTNALSEAVGQLLGQLPEREAMVLKLHFGIGMEAPLTLGEIGQLPMFHLTRERIRQIENKAIRRIQRNPALMQILEDFEAA